VDVGGQNGQTDQSVERRAERDTLVDPEGSSVHLVAVATSQQECLRGSRITRSSDGCCGDERGKSEAGAQHGLCPRVVVTGVPGQRRSEPALTVAFEDVWQRQLAGSLRGYLRSMGATQHEIDDVLQETAVRALETDLAFEDEPHLRRWCFVVARRCWIDARRRASRTVTMEEAAHCADPTGADLLARVEDRQVLRRLVEVLPLLRPADREALLSPVTMGDADPHERNRRNVARHRARRRLKALLGPLGAVTGCGLAGLLRRSPRASTTVAAAVPVLFVFALGAPAGSTGPSTSLTPSVSTAKDAAVAADVTATRRHEPPALPRPPVNAMMTPARAVAPGLDQEVGGTRVLSSLEAPGQTHVSVTERERTAEDALLCLTGDLVRVCIEAAVPVPSTVQNDGESVSEAGGQDVYRVTEASVPSSSPTDL
jgi:hypothetical protein